MFYFVSWFVSAASFIKNVFSSSLIATIALNVVLLGLLSVSVFLAFEQVYSLLDSLILEVNELMSSISSNSGSGSVSGKLGSVLDYFICNFSINVLISNIFNALVSAFGLYLTSFSYRLYYLFYKDFLKVSKL